MEWRYVVLALGVGVLTAVLADAERRRGRWRHDPRPDPPTSDHADDVSAMTLSSQFGALSAGVESLQALVADLHRDKVSQHSILMERIDAATRSDAALRETTDALVRTFAHPAHRGRWGERSAVDVLTKAGLVEGVTFARQRTLTVNGSKPGVRPDITFFLPQGRVLHLDVKFPIDNYVRHVEATDDTERDRSRQAFLKDVRSSIRNLAARNYSDRRESVDHILLYVPSEAIFGFVCESDPGLIDDALDRGVIVCSPFTMLSIVSIIREAVDQFCLEQRTHQIIEALDGFESQWKSFGESLDRVDRHLVTLSNSFAELAGPRRRGLDAALSAMSSRGEWVEVAE